MERTARLRGHLRGASTGPRSCERGWTPLRRTINLVEEASTGPRSCERGWAKRNDLVLRAAPLQRGRAHVSADGKVVVESIPPAEMLQRGRAHVSADGFPVFRAVGFPSTGFNGAALM